MIDRLLLACGVALSLTITRAEPAFPNVGSPTPSQTSLTEDFVQLVAQHLTVPPSTATDYAGLLDAAPTREAIAVAALAFIAMVGRNPNVQALFIMLLRETSAFRPGSERGRLRSSRCPQD